LARDLLSADVCIKCMIVIIVQITERRRPRPEPAPAVVPMIG